MKKFLILLCIIALLSSGFAASLLRRHHKKNKSHKNHRLHKRSHKSHLKINWDNVSFTVSRDSDPKIQLQFKSDFEIKCEQDAECNGIIFKQDIVPIATSSDPTNWLSQSVTFQNKAAFIDFRLVKNCVFTVEKKMLYNSLNFQTSAFESAQNNGPWNVNGQYPMGSANFNQVDIDVVAQELTDKCQTRQANMVRLLTSIADAADQYNVAYKAEVYAETELPKLVAFQADLDNKLSVARNLLETANNDIAAYIQQKTELTALIEPLEVQAQGADKVLVEFNAKQAELTLTAPQSSYATSQIVQASKMGTHRTELLRVVLNQDASQSALAELAVRGVENMNQTLSKKKNHKKRRAHRHHKRV